MDHAYLALALPLAVLLWIADADIEALGGPLMTPEVFQAALLAWLAVLAVLVAPTAALVILVLKAAKDIQAAWDLLHKHDATLKGDNDVSRRVSGG